MTNYDRGRYQDPRYAAEREPSREAQGYDRPFRDPRGESSARPYGSQGQQYGAAEYASGEYGASEFAPRQGQGWHGPQQQGQQRQGPQYQGPQRQGSQYEERYASDRGPSSYGSGPHFGDPRDMDGRYGESRYEGARFQESERGRWPARSHESQPGNFRSSYGDGGQWYGGGSREQGSGRSRQRYGEWQGGGWQAASGGRSDSGWGDSGGTYGAGASTLERSGDYAGSGPYAGKGPKGYKRSDEKICEDANERLERHGQLDASEVEVSCEGGVLKLKGKVENRSAKRAAEECVEGVYGVRDVMNSLEVDSSAFSGSDRDDNNDDNNKGSRSSSSSSASTSKVVQKRS